MQTGSNCRSWEKMILLTREGFFRLLNNYAEPRYTRALDWLRSPHPPSSPAPTPPLLPYPNIQSSSSLAKPLGYWETLMSVSQQCQPPAWKVRDLRSLIFPPELCDFLISCRLYLHTSLLLPAPVRSLLMLPASPRVAD